MLTNAIFYFVYFERRVNILTIAGKYLQVPSALFFFTFNAKYGTSLVKALGNGTKLL